MVQSLLTEDGPDGVSAEHVQSMLDELLDSDLTYSVQNSVRRRLVCEQLGKEGFLQGAILIESIISVLEPGVNALFGRTGKLTRLTALGSSHPEYQDLKEQCQESFLRMILGDFGYDLISRTMTLLEGGLSENLAMGWQLSDNRMRLLFQLVCAVSSDLWRRLVSESLRCPAKVFSLLRCKTLGEFVQLWDNIQQARSLCQTRVDMEFTEPLLAAFGPQPLAQRNPMSQTLVQVEVCELLSHMASFTPLNSDSVEVKHGAVQWAVSNKSVRRVKKPNVAREVSILQSAIRNYTSLHAEVSKMTLPPARVAAAIRRQVGVTSSNQHSKRLEADGQPVRRPMESNESKKQRIAAAESRNLRALSGWNVFQREGLGGKQLGLAEYNNAVKTLSHQWRQMTDEQKQPYEIQAVHEEHVRSRVAESGLSTKEQIETQHPMLEVSARLAEQVGKKGLSKISAKRLAINEELFESHSLWSGDSQLGDGHGALKVSCIDVTTPDSAVDSFLQNTIHKQACPEEIAKEIDSVKDLQVHDEPCLVRAEDIASTFEISYWLTKMILEFLGLWFTLPIIGLALAKSSKFCLPQSRKRLYIIMVRDDVCDEKTVQNLGEIVQKVLPQAMQADGASSTKTQKLVKAFKKELGISPYGSIPLYSETELQKSFEPAKYLNQRERDCLDVHYGTLVATWMAG
ncbi:PARP-type domain-containing protein (Fragment) [Durusdinium trenchii]|uniref:PARP-type domain-containing protein n=1 Tax=Durusdinium trenchii TaxID=1381693 RepID=A0ABP0L644_9DINO